ncbi:MAG TPA: beta-propeller fold lactonase family protein [Conexibacter sp.]|nr:beta-propeller fold lactonase family protein [Conexibacter sp.]
MSWRRPVVGALLALVAACPSPAGAAPVGQLSYATCYTGAPSGCPVTGLPAMSDLTDVAVSPDGRSVYVTSYTSASITRFDRDPATGKLTRAGCITSAMGCGSAAVDGKPGLDGARSVAVSADGHSVYVVGETADAVAAFARDTRTGALTYVGCITGAATGCTGAGAVSKAGLDAPESVAVSPDGDAVFVASYNSSAIAGFVRNPTTSALRYVACFAQGPVCGGGGNDVVGLGGAEDVVFSPDGANIYVSAFVSQAVTRFTRDPATGAVSYDGCHTAGSGCTGGANGVASLTHAYQSVLDPTGRNLYTVSQNGIHALTSFDRDGPTGALTYTGCFDAGAVCGGGRDGIAQLLYPYGVAVSPDGRSLYVTGNYSSALMRFDRDTRDGKLTRRDCFTQQTGCGAGHDGLAPLQYPFQLAVSPDGRDVYVQTAGRLLDFRRVPDTPPACAPPAAAGTTPGTSVRIVLRCADANGDAFSVRFPAVPAHGVLTRSADGGSVLYVPDSGYRGSDSFSVQPVDVYGVAGRTSKVGLRIARGLPRLSRLALAPPTFRAASRGGSIAATRRHRAPPIGTTVSYRLDRAARVAFTVTQRTAGIRRDGRCVAVPRRHASKAKAKRCTRVLKLGGFARASRAGAAHFHFSGRVGGKALAPGVYTLAAVAKGSGGTRSARPRAPFAIARAR